MAFSAARNGVRVAFLSAFITGLALSAFLPTSVHAQQRDSVRAPSRPDSVRIVAPKVSRAPRLATRLTPPITAKRAFLYSLALPGLGQSKLDRGVGGALFSGVELGALTMLRRSSADLREARRYVGDSLPITFAVNGSTVSPTGLAPNGYTADLVRTRRLHVEDWLAALAFNHLISGADAFVSAQLWDVPVRMAAIPRSDGVMLVATLRW